jgi:GntR family transcriptional repressor for pyruvate dehydrogenase complex
MQVVFNKIKYQSRTQRIVDKFREAIEDGTLRTGDKLPPERELCIQLGVSRTALREALHTLQAYGLVKATQGGGTYITDKFSENVFDFLGFGKALTKKNFKHLLNARKILESGAVEQALKLIKTGGAGLPADDDGEVDFDSLVDEQEKETDPRRLGILDAGFHEKLVGMSRNPVIVALYRMIHTILLQGTQQAIAYPSGRQIVLRDHREIAKAFKSRDAAACVRAIQTHLKNTEENIEQYISQED